LRLPGKLKIREHQVYRLVGLDKGDRAVGAFCLDYFKAGRSWASDTSSRIRLILHDELAHLQSQMRMLGSLDEVSSICSGSITIIAAAGQWRPTLLQGRASRTRVSTVREFGKPSSYAFSISHCRGASAADGFAWLADRDHTQRDN
jgi:hypothetical protein